MLIANIEIATKAAKIAIGVWGPARDPWKKPLNASIRGSMVPEDNPILDGRPGLEYREYLWGIYRFKSKMTWWSRGAAGIGYYFMYSLIHLGSKIIARWWSAYSSVTRLSGSCLCCTPKLSAHLACCHTHCITIPCHMRAESHRVHIIIPAVFNRSSPVSSRPVEAMMPCLPDNVAQSGNFQGPGIIEQYGKVIYGLD